MRQSKQLFFEQGDKAGKLLAHQAREAYASRLISKIKLPSGNTISDPAEINRVFFEYQSNLYKSERPLNPSELHCYLDVLNYPKVNESMAVDMGRSISTLEVQEAIGSLQNGKSTGPDGFTVEFYKAFSTQLLPVFTRLYNDSFDKGRLPLTLSAVTISLLFLCSLQLQTNITLKRRFQNSGQSSVSSSSADYARPYCS